MLALAWIVFIIFVSLAVLYSIGLYLYYRDPHESERFPAIVITVALFITFLSVLILPLDVYTISSLKNNDGTFAVDIETQNSRVAGVQIVYYVVFFMDLILFFIIIPFAYFYYEEFDVTDKGDNTWQQRASGSCRYVIFLVVILIVIVMIGLFMQAPAADKDKDHWKQALYDNENVADRSLTVVLGLLTLGGFFCWILYTSWGMGMYPMGLIRGTTTLEQESSSVEGDLNVARDQRKLLEQKYMLSGKKMDKKDAKKLELLTRQERLLDSRKRMMDTRREGKLEKLARCLYPFRALIGVVFVLVSLLIFVSLSLVQMDRSLNSMCGASCGFIINKSKYMNPFDELMLSVPFPLDFLILLLVTASFILFTMGGLSRIGIWFLWIRLYKVKPHKTVPQALLFTALITMMAFLASLPVFLTLSPQYMTFGRQHYIDAANNTVPCTIEASGVNNVTKRAECVMSVMATYVNRIIVKLPFFGIIFFASVWASLLIVMISYFVGMTRKKPSMLAVDSDDEQTDDMYL